jgi:hypothetical protein
MSAVKPIHFGWASLPLWIAGTTVGWAFGFIPPVLSITSTSYSDMNVETKIVSGTDVRTDIVSGPLIGIFILLLVIASSGAITGLSQQVALRAYNYGQFRAKCKWFLRTLAGTTLGWALGLIGVLCTYAFNPPNSLGTWLLRGLMVGTAVGLSTGLAQGDLLGSDGFNGKRWALISTVSWVAASIVYWLVYYLTGGPFEATTIYYNDGLWPTSYDAPRAWPAMINGWLAGGLLLGSVTGIAIKLLARDTARLTAE